MHEVLLRLPEFGLWVGDTQVSWGYMAVTLQAWLEQGRRKVRPHLFVHHGNRAKVQVTVL